MVSLGFGICNILCKRKRGLERLSNLSKIPRQRVAAPVGFKLLSQNHPLAPWVTLRDWNRQAWCFYLAPSTLHTESQDFLVGRHHCPHGQVAKLSSTDVRHLLPGDWSTESLGLQWQASRVAIQHIQMSGNYWAQCSYVGKGGNKLRNTEWLGQGQFSGSRESPSFIKKRDLLCWFWFSSPFLRLGPWSFGPCLRVSIVTMNHRYSKNVEEKVYLAYTSSL